MSSTETTADILVILLLLGRIAAAIVTDGLLVTILGSAKMTEPIVVPFRMLTWVCGAQGPMCQIGVQIPTQSGNLDGVWPIEKHCKRLSCAKTGGPI